MSASQQQGSSTFEQLCRSTARSNIGEGGQTPARVYDRTHISGSANVIMGDVKIDLSDLEDFLNITYGRSKDELVECLQELGSIDPEDDRAAILRDKGTLVAQSCTWINDKFETFSRSPRLQALWIHGRPGKGKTMMLVYLIDKLKPVCRNQSFLASFFCRFDNPEQRTTVSFLKSVIKQLLKYEFHDSNIHNAIVTRFLKEYASQGTKMFSSWCIQETLTRILHQMLTDLPVNSYIVLDALDEFESSSVLDVVNQLIRDPLCCNLKWIFSSREPPSVPDLTPATLLEINLEDRSYSTSVENGVKAFIEKKVDELEHSRTVRMNSYFGTEDCMVVEKGYGGVKDILIERAEGSFLWVALAIEIIVKDPLDLSWLDADTHIDKLAALYNRVVEQLFNLPIASQNSSTTSDSRKSIRKDIITKLLHVLCISYRPLSLSELSTAIRLDNIGIQAHDGIQGMSLTIRDIILQCRWLLKLQEGSVHFVHLSAKDHLMNRKSPLFSFQREWAHHLLMTNSIQCLLENTPDSIRAHILPGKSTVEDRPFLDYAKEFWVQHSIDLQTYAPSNQDIILIHDFLLSEQGQAWFIEYMHIRSIQVYPKGQLSIRSASVMTVERATRGLGADVRSILPPDRTNENPSEIDATRYVNEVAAILGLYGFLSARWSNDRTSPTIDSLGALVAFAAANGHLNIVQAILKHAKPLDTLTHTDSWSIYLRQVAAYASVVYGREHVLKFVWSSSTGNPLTIPQGLFLIAVCSGFADVVSFLIKKVGVGVEETLSFETSWTRSIQIVLGQAYGRPAKFWEYHNQANVTIPLANDLEYSPSSQDLLADKDSQRAVEQLRHSYDVDRNKICGRKVRYWVAPIFMQLSCRRYLSHEMYDSQIETWSTILNSMTLEMKNENFVPVKSQEIVERSRDIWHQLKNATRPRHRTPVSFSMETAVHPQGYARLDILDFSALRENFGLLDFANAFLDLPPPISESLVHGVPSQPICLKLRGQLKSPLQLAAEGGHLKTVKVLLEARGIFDSNVAQLALRDAVDAANYDLAECLLKAQASPNACEAPSTNLPKSGDFSGESMDIDPYKAGLPMLYATAIRGHHWIVKLLLPYTSPQLTRKLWNLALKCSYLTASPFAHRAKAVVLSFSLISETFGGYPDGWAVYRTEAEKNDFYVNASKGEVTWQDPRIPCEPEESMDFFLWQRNPPRYMLSPDLQARLEDYDVSAAPSSDELELDD